MHKIKPGTHTTGAVKRKFKETIERFVARANTVSVMSSAKGTTVYWKKFLHDVLAMIKQLEILTYFLTLIYADLRSEELPLLTNLTTLDIVMRN